jgi:hypothetical protein
MTIAAGFVCSDGLLFASDTLYSGEQNTYGRKFWTLIKGDSVIVFGGAGLAPSLKRTRDLIDQTVTASMDRDEVIVSIEKALEYVETLIKPQDHERTYALIGLRMAGNYWLYENEGGRSVLTGLNENSQCVGAGHSLGLYFARSLFLRNMPLAWTKVIAAHLIKHVKTYNSGWCGGDTHLLELPLNGPPKFEADQKEIEKLEAILAEVDEATRMVIPAGEGVSEATLGYRLEKLNELIRNLRSAVVIRVGPLSAGVKVGDWISAALADVRMAAGQPLGSPATLLFPPATPSAPEAPQDPGVPPDPEDPKGGS